MQRGLHNLGRVNNALGHEVAVLASVGIEAFTLTLELTDAINHNGAFEARVFGNASQRILEHLTNNANASLLVVRKTLERIKSLFGANQSHTAAGNNPLSQGRCGGALGVIQQVLAFLHLGFSRSTDADLGNAASQLGQPFLQLLAVVVAVHRFDLTTNLSDASFNCFLLASSPNHHGFLGGKPQFLYPTQVGQLDALQVNAAVLENRVGAGQRGDVTQDSLTAIAVTRSLYGRYLQNAPHLVDHQRRECFAIDILGNDQQLLLRLADCLKQRNQSLIRRNFFFVNQDVTVFHLHADFVLVGDKVRRKETAVKLHTLDHFNGGLAAAPFFNRDHAIFANLKKRVGQNTANRRVVVTGDRGNLLNLFLALGVNRFGLTSNLVANRGNCLADTARESHRVKTRSNHLQTFAENSFGQNRGCRGSVASHIIGLAGRFLHQLNAEIFVRVIQFDVLSDGHTVLGHLGAAPTLVENRIPATRP